MSISAMDQMADVITELQRKVADLEADKERLQSNIVALFKRGKADGGHCKYCNAPVYYLIHQDSQKRGIYDPDGTSHWATCPNVVQARAEMSRR